MLLAYEFSLAKPEQIILAGERGAADMRRLLASIACGFVPNRIVLLVDAESRAALALCLPTIAGMSAIEGKATAYVCENYACQLPTTDVAAFRQLLQ